MLSYRRSWAGKTLAGLNIANERLKADESEHSVFLSGNGPLVDVLKRSVRLVNSVETAKEKGDKLKKQTQNAKQKHLSKIFIILEMYNLTQRKHQ